MERYQGYEAIQNIGRISRTVRRIKLEDTEEIYEVGNDAHDLEIHPTVARIRYRPPQPVTDENMIASRTVTRELEMGQPVTGKVTKRDLTPFNELVGRKRKKPEAKCKPSVMQYFQEIRQKSAKFDWNKEKGKDASDTGISSIKPKFHQTRIHQYFKPDTANSTPLCEMSPSFFNTDAIPGTSKDFLNGDELDVIPSTPIFSTTEIRSPENYVMEFSDTGKQSSPTFHVKRPTFRNRPTAKFHFTKPKPLYTFNFEE